ncbi:MAG: hypothetical protein IM319_03740 [Microcystis sp. M113S1]|uniref:hypothetical protein n=1 Tax=Microcystis sp. M113S1 TaxID=2771104 RepID=UPI00258B085B|nr:hypothetical protein [Microcystis sp. M113S1]MCA2938307.1 hypothetical protein [Microcystis sp. M113S1]
MVYRTSAFGLLALTLLVSGVSVSASQRMTGVRESQVNDGINSRRDTQLLAQANVNEYKWYEAAFQGCKRNGPSVQCAVVVRGKAGHYAIARCQEGNLTRLFDTSGNVYPCAKIKIGNQEAQSHLKLKFPQGTPVKVTLTFNNVSSQVNEFYKIEISFGYIGDTDLLEFEDIKLPR